jgi:carbonic anhydrase/acetyltransferase-like protein (isoleucine patch superfamily)
LYGWTHQVVLLTLDLHLYALSALQAFENTPLCIWWFKGMGATSGYDAETCPTITVVPDLLHLGKSSFITTGVTTGSVVVCSDSIFLNTITLEDYAFIGDQSYIGPSARLQNFTLLGAQSAMPESNVLPSGETWVGNPSYPIPMHSKPDSDEEIDTGRGWRWAGDIGAQVWFLILGFPLLSVFIPMFWYLRGLVGEGEHSPTCSSEADPILCALAMHLPTIVLVSTILAAMVMPYIWLSTIVFKWAVLGRLAPRQAPINSPFMARKKMTEDAVKAADKLSSPFRLCIALPIDCWFLRSLGATIGSNVWMTEHDTILSWEMDLMTVGDNAILHDASLQGHTFEDKVFKLDRISVGKQTVLGPSCTILQGAHIEDNVIVESQSLVMKAEHLSEHSTWAGLTASQVL